MLIRKFFSDIYIDVLLYVVFLVYILFNIEYNSVNILVLSIIIISQVFWVMARVQLGTAFSVTPKATKLVTRGIYKRIRNPIYFFTAIADFGIIYLLGNAYLYILVPVIVILQFFRANKEEKVLSEKFGKEYADYKKSTWF